MTQPKKGPSTKQKKLPKKVQEAIQKNQQEKRWGRQVKKTHSRPELPQIKPDQVFKDRDGKNHTFSESALKRVAAQLLHKHKKQWRYRNFSFPVIGHSGNEMEVTFDFYVYDSNDTIVRVILVVPSESRELWDRLGLFKKQFPMYTHEVWTPETMAELLEKSWLGY